MNTFQKIKFILESLRAGCTYRDIKARLSLLEDYRQYLLGDKKD